MTSVADIDSDSDLGYYSDEKHSYDIAKRVYSDTVNYFGLLILDKLYSFFNRNTILKFKLINVYSVIPKKSDPGSAGYDVYSVEDKVIKAGKRELVNIGIATEFPRYYYLRCAPRSGLSLTYSIDVGAGVIDSSYRGEIKVLLINNGTTDFKVHKGDRVAQLIMERAITPTIKICDSLLGSERADKGFGSSGIN
jgi:dUTP pyrophosphatase